MGRELRALAAVVGLHVLVHATHGAVHESIPVPTTGWQLWYVALVVFAAPVAGVLLAGRGSTVAGAAVVAAAGFGSLVFEVLFHFVLANPDHVGHVTAGAVPFATTAAVAAAGDLALVGAGAWVLRRER